jgi:hypothetical protein
MPSNDTRDLLSNFTVVALPNRRQLQALAPHITPELWGALPPAGELDHDNRRPLHATLSLATQLASTAVAIEASYISTNYSDEYQAFYSRLFRTIPNKCHRLLFLSKDLARPDLLSPDELAGAVIGSSVLRPTNSMRVGPTLLPPSRKAFTGEAHVTVAPRFKVHICGEAFDIRCAPFIQQDTNVGVCAHATLWMTARVMCESFGGARLRSSEIARIANHDGSSVSSGGLSPKQMVDAIRQMGYRPLAGSLKAWKDGDVPQDLGFIASYVASGIPVIIGICPDPEKQYLGHTLAVVGFTLGTASAPKVSGLAAPWLTGLIVHDDAAGPYLHKPLKSVDVKAIGHTIRYYFVPQPPRVSLQVKDVHDFSHHLVSIANKLIDKVAMRDDVALAPSPFTKRERSELVVLPLLLESNAFRRAAASLDIEDDLKALYRSMPLPRYVWYAELATREQVSEPNIEARRCVGEVLFDSTGDGRSLASVLSFHLYGRVFQRDAERLLPRRLWEYSPSRPHQSLYWRALRRASAFV